jgi:L-fucose mutarotase
VREVAGRPPAVADLGTSVLHRQVSAFWRPGDYLEATELFNHLVPARTTFMLKKIPNILSPELLLMIAQMGHGDELVIADANFPAVSNAKRLVRADGHGVAVILEAILQLLPLDSFVDHPAAVMRRIDKPGEPAPIWAEYQRILDSAEGRHIAMEQVERFAFYDRAKTTFGVVATGEGALYGNIIIKKGIIPPS